MRNSFTASTCSRLSDDFHVYPVCLYPLPPPDPTLSPPSSICRFYHRFCRDSRPQTADPLLFYASATRRRCSDSIIIGRRDISLA